MSLSRRRAQRLAEHESLAQRLAPGANSPSPEIHHQDPKPLWHVRRPQVFHQVEADTRELQTERLSARDPNQLAHIDERRRCSPPARCLTVGGLSQRSYGERRKSAPKQLRTMRLQRIGL